MTSLAIRRAPATLQPFAIALLVSSIFPLKSFAQATAEQTLQPVVVTATRTPQKVTDVLSDTVVISSEEITQSGQTNLLDLLQMKRGIEISRNGGAGTSANVYLRGANPNQLVLLIDGVRSVSSTVGSPDWSAVPLSQIDHVEIVFGPLGTLYGADAVGGVIQVFTKKGDGSPRITFSAGAGTYGEQVYSAGVSGSVGKEHVFRYSVQAVHEEADGFSATLPHAAFGYNPDDDGYSKKSLGGRFSLELAKGQEIGVSFLNSSNNAEYDSGLFTFNTHSLSEINTYSAYLRNQITADWTSLLQFSRSYTNLRDYSAPGPFGYSRFNSVQDQISWQNDLRINDSNTFQIIAEHRKEDVDSTEQGLNRDRTNDALSLAYQFKDGAHSANASVRYDDNSDYGSHTTGSLGYGYAFNETWRLHTGIGTSFRAPTYADLYVPWGGIASNKPEKGKNAEIGVSYDDGRSSFSASYYHNRVKDLLVYEFSCPVAGMPAGCTTNVDDALLEGFSLGAAFRFNSSVTMHASVDLQNPRNEETNDLLSRRARYHGNFGIDYVAGRLAAGGDVVFSGKRYDSTERIGGYALLNLHASYDLTKDWQVFARWNNVFDKFYELAYGYQTPGSNAFIGVRYGFN